MTPPDEAAILEREHEGPVIDLMSEFVEAAASATAQHYEALIDAGVRSAFLYGGACRFGIAEIAASKEGLFEPMADGGRRAFILPMRPLSPPWEDADDDDIGDLIAWSPKEPLRFYTRCGAAAVMNPDAITKAEILREPLAVWSNPISWMVAGGDGIVVVSPSANLRLWIGGVECLVFGSFALAEAIERRLRQPPLKQRLLVRERRRVA